MKTIYENENTNENTNEYDTFWGEYDEEEERGIDQYEDEKQSAFNFFHSLFLYGNI